MAVDVLEQVCSTRVSFRFFAVLAVREARGFGETWLIAKTVSPPGPPQFQQLIFVLDEDDGERFERVRLQALLRLDATPSQTPDALRRR